MGKTKKGTNYAWDRWLKVGAKHTLHRGKDYFGADRTMCAYIYRQARRRKVKVMVSQPKEGVIKITIHRGELDGRSL
jgi:hypothetical protein